MGPLLHPDKNGPTMLAYLSVLFQFGHLRSPRWVWGASCLGYTNPPPACLPPDGPATHQLKLQCRTF